MNPPESTEPVVWLNGAYLPLPEARISVMDRGFQFGDGLFETLRADQGRVLLFGRHLRRLAGAARHYRLSEAFLNRIPWGSVISELLARNHLDQRIARVKIIVTRGIAGPLGLPEANRPTVCVSATGYQPPAPEDYARGWSAHLARTGYAAPLAGHKTLNYLFYLVARQEAMDYEKDEAILVGADGCLAETATGSLLLLRGDTWYRPDHALQLPGTAIERALELLNEQGCAVRTEKIPATDLATFDGAWTLNSMIGILPICEIDGQAVPLVREHFIQNLRQQLFETA